jgi:hypothetical protein
MTMVSAPPPYSPPRRGFGSGCLLGCLFALLLASLPFLLAGGFGAWLWTSGYRNDPALRLARELVRSDGLAQQVLGPNITVTGIDSNSFSWMPGASRHSYDLALEGARGEGHLAVTAHADAGGAKLDSAILTGPDGRRYDLLKHEILPGGRPDDSI